MSDVNIEEFAKQIAGHVRPAVPIEHALWDTQDIAGYMRKSAQVVRERIACLPNFPQPIRVPSKRGDKMISGHPLWKAKEVIDWTESHREKIGRPRKAG